MHCIALHMDGIGIGMSIYPFLMELGSVYGHVGRRYHRFIHVLLDADFPTVLDHCFHCL